MTAPYPATDKEPLRRLTSHELRFRRLQVVSITPVTHRLTRVTVGGAELDGFTSLAPDDHVKVLFPPPGADEPSFPEVVAGHVSWPPGRSRPLARDYTPTRFDAKARELDIEIVLHEGGHATAWLRKQARPGAILGVAGPRGSHAFTRVPSSLLMAGDETVLPAIARWLRELPAGTDVHAFIEVNDSRDEVPLPTRANLKVRWLHRGRAEVGTTTLLADAVRSAALPQFEYAFVAGEAGAVKHLRLYLLNELRLPSDAFSARGYWKRGTDDHQEPHDD
ncbi:siderophore-interacting protein [Hyalangium versicolor]|uniref:siderophore-interacting protein n=1 Tax=Hyalangium versicolor TaxID=2861190 RepID=UPI001CCB0FB8|nr:siderophore-interacting protein [Hyalangium versicolor]